MLLVLLLLLPVEILFCQVLLLLFEILVNIFLQGVLLLPVNRILGQVLLLLLETLRCVELVD